jgi:hypothetical protein
MREVSQEWNALIENWAAIEAELEREKPSGKCPETYTLIKQALEPFTIRASARPGI